MMLLNLFARLIPILHYSKLVISSTLLFSWGAFLNMPKTLLIISGSQNKLIILFNIRPALNYNLIVRGIKIYFNVRRQSTKGENCSKRKLDVPSRPSHGLEIARWYRETWKEIFATKRYTTWVHLKNRHERFERRKFFPYQIITYDEKDKTNQNWCNGISKRPKKWKHQNSKPLREPWVYIKATSVQKQQSLSYKQIKNQSYETSWWDDILLSQKYLPNQPIRLA